MAASEEEDPATTFIARQIQAGEGDAAWEPMAAKVERFLRKTHGLRKLPDDLEFEDFRQEVLIRLYPKILTMKVGSRLEFWGYVKLIAEHAEVDLLRMALAEKRGGGRQFSQEVEAGEDGASPLSSIEDRAAFTASKFAQASEIEQIELDCAEELQIPEQRNVYLMRRRQSLGYAAIASAVGRDKTVTVKVMYKRARDKVLDRLRVRLDGYATELERGLPPE